MILTRPKEKPDQFLVDEILRRLNPPLPAPSSRPVDMPVLPSPVITRSMVDVGEPPVDPLMGMEAARNTDYQPNYSTGVASFPSRAPEIPELLSRPIDIAPDPSQPQFGNEVISRSMAPMYRSKLEALQGSSPQSGLEQVDGGYNVAPPQRMSRLKAFGLGALRGFGMGGLGGLLTGGAIGAISPNTIQKFERRQDIGQAQNDYAQNLQLQREGLQNENLTSEIAARNEALINRPILKRDKDYQTTVAHLLSLRDTTDPAEFEQMKRAEEVRLGKPINLPRYSKQGQAQGNGEFNLPPGGARYRTNPDGSVTPIIERPMLPEKPNTDAVGKGQAELESANTRAAAAQTAAQAYQSQLAALDEQAKSIPTYGPQMVKNENGIMVPATNPDGSVVYGQTKTSERAQYEQRREEIQKKLETAQKDWNEANADLRKVYVPPTRGGLPVLTRSTLSPDVEARIRAAAADKGLDPDIAVSRARARQ